MGERGGPLLPTSAGSDERLLDAAEARDRYEAKARKRLLSGSRLARGLSALVSGVPAVSLVTGAVALVSRFFAVGNMGDLVGAVVLTGFATPFAFLTFRWLRGQNPTVPPPDPLPDEIKQLAAKIEHDEGR